MTIVGRNGVEPEFRTSSKGKQYTRLSVATKGKKDEPAEWYSVFLWDPLAELLKPHITKGTLVFVEGRPKQGSYTDSSGETRAAFSITAEKCLVLGGWKSDQEHAAQQDREGYAASKLDSPSDFPF